MKTILIAAAATLFYTGAALAQSGPSTSPLKGPKGEDMGTISLAAAPTGVLLKIDAKGLPPGWHGLHFHDKGSCSDAKFESAGGHVHEGTSVHGLMNPARTDSGDLPNLYVGRDGTAHAEIFSGLVKLDKAEGAVPALRDADGSAVIIHANPDDYMSQPIGGAGARIACATVS